MDTSILKKSKEALISLKKQTEAMERFVQKCEDVALGRKNKKPTKTIVRNQCKPCSPVKNKRNYLSEYEKSLNNKRFNTNRSNGINPRLRPIPKMNIPCGRPDHCCGCRSTHPR